MCDVCVVCDMCVCDVCVWCDVCVVCVMCVSCSGHNFWELISLPPLHGSRNQTQTCTANAFTHSAVLSALQGQIINKVERKRMRVTGNFLFGAILTQREIEKCLCACYLIF